MRRFSKAQQKTVSDAQDACQKAATALEKAVEAYNEATDSLWSEVDDAVLAYNDKLNDLRGVYQEIAEEAQAYYDDRSDNWRDGEVGEAYADWINQLESLDVDDITLDQPDKLEVEAPDFSSPDFLPPEEVGR